MWPGVEVGGQPEVTQTGIPGNKHTISLLPPSNLVLVLSMAKPNQKPDGREGYWSVSHKQAREEREVDLKQRMGDPQHRGRS